MVPGHATRVAPVMIIALIDNGSLEPAATINLRTVAAQISVQAAVNVQPVSWKHSDRVPAGRLDDEPAWTLEPWLQAQLAAGHTQFLFIPFFISAQGAIGSALRGDLEKLQATAAATTPFTFAFTGGLASAGALPPIVAARVRETVDLASLEFPPVIVVDHGGPSPASAELRNHVAAEVAKLLNPEPDEFMAPRRTDDEGLDLRPTRFVVAAASMEGEAHAHNRPLLAEQLRAPGFSSGSVVIALLFLSPGRHAGFGGDIAHICAAAEAEDAELQCDLTDLVGTHPLAVDALTEALQTALSSQIFPSPP